MAAGSTLHLSRNIQEFSMTGPQPQPDPTQFTTPPMPQAIPPTYMPVQEIPLDQRRRNLAMAVASEVARGGRVESQTDTD
ncbi:hypothetical protein ACW9HQ_36765, partial [Nocardia gipuzkoensis]